MNARPLVSALALAALALHASGCESCDFSFGPVIVEVSTTPIDRAVTVTVCPEDEICRTITLPAADGDTDSDTDSDINESADPNPDAPGPGGPAVFEVGWHGYGVCKLPEMTVRVEAEGCAPIERHFKRRRPDHSEDDRILSGLAVTVDLECS